MAMNPNLDEMNLEELKALSREIEKAIRKTATENLKKARDAAEAAARQFGFARRARRKAHWGYDQAVRREVPQSR